MAVYEVSCDGLEISSCFTGIPDMSLEVVKVETLLILQENLFDLLLELGGPVSRWMFSVPDLFQQILFRIKVDMLSP